LNTTPNSSPTLPPADLLAQIQARFRELDLYGQKVTLTHHGRRYAARCDDHAFSIYRVNEKGHVPPGVPGWPVCLVTADAAVDEYSHPALEEDDFASGLTIQDWLRLIEETFGK
jgi:hypothetical protein